MSNRSLNISQPIVRENGTIEREFEDLVYELIREIRFFGSGSPEGEVTAAQFSEYVDVDGVSGSIKYIKIKADIGGDRSLGWVLM